MKVKCVSGDTMRLELEPQTEVDSMFLRLMADASEKGATTILAAPGRNEEAYVLEVGK